MDDRPLEERLADLHDKDGSMRVMVEGLRILTGNPLGRTFTKHVLKQDPDEYAELLASYDDTLTVTAEGIRQFAAHGWAPNDRTPLSGMKEALRVLGDGGTLADAETVLVDAYDKMLSGAWTIARVHSLGHPSDEYNAVFRERGRLLHKAWEHHHHGRYDASVPIIYAQVEGITYDVTGKPFFSRKNGVDPVDNTTLAGFREALPVARQWFNEGMNFTAASGSGSRHGVLHGRELAYDTKLVSTKAFTLLLAVLDWARPLAAELGLWFETIREQGSVGSTETDGDGRRHDRREFAATCKALQWLSTCQTGWYRNRGEGFRPELVHVLADNFTKYGLPADHGIHLHVTDDRESWYAWRTTITGYTFAIGANSSAERNGVLSEWRYEGTTPPSGPPGIDPAWGDKPYRRTPNWRTT